MSERLRVLIVEDCPDTASSTAMILHLSGMQTRIAHTGKSALAEAEQTPPDLILLDLGLPDMNGLDVARTLRKQSRFDRTMIVVLSGYGSHDDHSQAVIAGCQRYFVKPVDVMALQRMVQRELAQFRLELAPLCSAETGDAPYSR